jgi:hypothetical protein
LASQKCESTSRHSRLVPPAFCVAANCVQCDEIAVRRTTGSAEGGVTITEALSVAATSRSMANHVLKSHRHLEAGTNHRFRTVATRPALWRNGMVRPCPPRPGCVGAHHLSRRLHSLGHDARLMPAKYVKPYRKGQKNDFRDAEAIAEAVQRPTMKFVATKQPINWTCKRCIVRVSAQ